ncbi:hypothetical protein V7123_15310, partial [Bacillus toyonensis]|uniref:hypothetical protein n=1 Tax=Bacillus toyonensis TaxID=155322 RepID=UPI002FFEBB3F
HTSLFFEKILDQNPCFCSWLDAISFCDLRISSKFYFNCTYCNNRILFNEFLERILLPQAREGRIQKALLFILPLI